jgi:hypothetical protein
LEAVEGGTTFDKHGAYALVLKDTGEVEACQGDAFTYRVPQWDKGKYRLTAATPRSRDPVRVLRSHSINSVWGPKAGVRYEGLYVPCKFFSHMLIELDMESKVGRFVKQSQPMLPVASGRKETSFTKSALNAKIPSHYSMSPFGLPQQRSTTIQNTSDFASYSARGSAEDLARRSISATSIPYYPAEPHLRSRRFNRFP